MKYDISFLPIAKKELSKIPIREYNRIKEVISKFTIEPIPNNCLKLSGRNAWRIRVGDYRVIYEIDDKNHEVIVVHIGHRKFIYKK